MQYSARPALRYHHLEHDVVVSIACCTHLVSLLHVWFVLFLFVIAVHYHVRINWTPARTMMLYWH